jgi:hypothetical protein
MAVRRKKSRKKPDVITLDEAARAASKGLMSLRLDTHEAAYAALWLARVLWVGLEFEQAIDVSWPELVEMVSSPEGSDMVFERRKAKAKTKKPTLRLVKA